MRRGCVILAGTFVLLGLALGPAAGSAAEVQPIRAGGTGSALGTMQLLASAFLKKHAQPNVITLVPNLGSSGGLRALKAGAIEMAFISRVPTADDAAAGLVAFEYGRSPFVFVTSMNNVTSITPAEVADFLSGRKLAWPDGESVRFVMRQPSDADNEHIAAFSPDIAAALKTAHSRDGLVVALTDQEAADQAEHLPGSLAVNTLALILSEHRKLHVLNFNGLVPSVKTLADGTYPYYKRLFIVTKGPATGTALEFIEFIKSPAGRAMLEANGHVVAP
jgi:phosphate transport system substrate-binding protein